MNPSAPKAAAPPVRSNGGVRIVVVLKWTALAATVGLFATFLIQAGMLEVITRNEPAAAPTDITQDKVMVSASSVHGFDDEEQPYSINSVSASQDPDQPHLVSLNIVTGKLRKASGQIVTVDADTGNYNSKIKTLDLAGNVRIVSADRFVATMPSARITLENKQLFTEDHVIVTLKSGNITANGLKITDDGKNITFLNRVKVKLRPSGEKENKQQ